MLDKKLCIFYNTAPLYRECIFLKMDATFSCDWYFRPTLTDIKEMDVSKLNSVTYLKIWGDPFKIYWKRGLLSLLFRKEYETYLMTLEVHCLTDWLFVLFKSIFFKHKRLYAWTHGYYGRESKIKKILKKWLFTHVTGSFTYGQYAKDIMIREGIPADSIFVIHNSLHYDKQLTLRKSIKPSKIFESHFGNNHKVLLFIGRLTKIKKLGQILDALYLLKNNGRIYNIVFVGDGSERRNLDVRVAQLNLSDQVWFYGSCYNEEENAEIIYNADLCVSPGNVGLTAIHSLVFGTPVLTHDNFKYQMPEFEAINEGKTGCFFSQNDVDSLAESINNWFQQNSNRRDEIRAQCFEEIDRYWNPNFQIEVLKKNIQL